MLNSTVRMAVRKAHFLDEIVVSSLLLTLKENRPDPETSLQKRLCRILGPLQAAIQGQQKQSSLVLIVSLYFLIFHGTYTGHTWCTE